MIKLPDFILIPYQLLEDEEITLIDERLYGIIYWLTKLKNERCFASNKTLSELVKTTPATIQNSLTKLEIKGYILRIFTDKSRRNRSEIIPLVIFFKVSPTDDSAYHPQMTRIRKDNKNTKKEEIADKSASNDFKEVMDYYYNLVLNSCGFKPEIRAKDGKILKTMLTKYSKVEVKNIIYWYLGLKDKDNGYLADKLGVDLSICLSANTINRYHNANK